MRLVDLPWLLPAPEPFSGVAGKLVASNPTVGADLVSLGKTRLSAAQLDRVGRRMEILQAEKGRIEHLDPVTIGLVTNGTSDFLARALRATGVRHGLDVRLVVADFDQAVQEALDPSSKINAARPDLVFLSLDHRGVQLETDGVPSPDAAQIAFDRNEMLRRSFAENAGSTILVQTLARPPYPLFGHYDRRVAGSYLEAVQTFNAKLAASLDGSGDLLFDLSSLAEQVGLSTWHDAGGWHSAKLPFAMECLPLWADHVCRILAAWRGKSRKVLVLDLDNTLWGGVIGDDGLDGIKIGQGDAVGEAHLAVQKVASALSKRGIVLAVCSKNDEANARLPFREHPDMLLRESDFAAFQANWSDKASNLVAIAKALNLGLDSFVFLDDNAMERDIVRQRLPEVAVPEVASDDPSDYADTILAAGYFETIAYSKEDRERAALYRDNAARDRLKVQAGTIDDYLKSLGMVIDIRKFDDVGRPRITQLINKTNQFNLTTLRCDENDVAKWQSSEEHQTFQVRLVDKFGDNGMISVIVAERRDGSTWYLVQWLMSCRVLNRRVENAVLNRLVAEAKRHGITHLVGSYIPTAKNAMVREHYRRLGFDLVQSTTDGGSSWRLDIEHYVPVTVPIEDGPPVATPL